jgi:acyl-CoA synthetase (NDP forming)
MGYGRASGVSQGLGSTGFGKPGRVEPPDILHKTEAGIIRLGLQDSDQVRSAYEAAMATATRYAPEGAIAGVSVQEMVDGAAADGG